MTETSRLAPPAGKGTSFDGLWFYERFCEDFRSVSGSKESCIGVHYAFEKVLGKELPREADWTTAMLGYLMVLAWRHDFLQLREVKHVDATWVRNSEADRRIVIEVENTANSALEENGEVPKLLRDETPVKVVLTQYPDRPTAYGGLDSPKKWQSEVLRRRVDAILKSPEGIRPEGEIDLLIALADRPPGERVPNHWDGFLWRRRSGRWNLSVLGDQSERGTPTRSIPR